MDINNPHSLISNQFIFRIQNYDKLKNDSLFL